MKKQISVILAALMTASLLAGCGASSQGVSSSEAPARTTQEEQQTAGTPAAGADSVSEAGNEADVRIFVDSAGREVEVPVEIKSIIPSGDMAQMFIWPLASDKLATVSKTLSETQKHYLGNSTDGLSETGNLYKTGSQLNIEEVAAIHPDIIIDFGEPKDTIVEDLDNLQELLGIPCVFIEGNLVDTASSYRMLGDLLNMPEEGERLAAYVEDIVGTVDRVFETTEKKDVVVLNGTDGLGCIASGTYFDEIWAYMMNNIAVVEEGQMYASTGIDIEQLAIWDPEYLFFYNSVDPETIVDQAAWSELTAVKNGHYYGVPTGPYSFVSPPSINRYLAMIWIAETVYPDDFDWDMQEKITEFYDLFYHFDLTDEEFEALMNTQS